MSLESLIVASGDTTPAMRTSSAKPNIDLSSKRPSVKASTSPLASTSRRDISSALSS
jgi:hypothetical protein